MAFTALARPLSTSSIAVVVAWKLKALAVPVDGTSVTVNTSPTATVPVSWWVCACAATPEAPDNTLAEPRVVSTVNALPALFTSTIESVTSVLTKAS